MGYHIILRATCHIHPDYIFLFDENHTYFENDFDANTLPTPYRELIELWQQLGIDSNFYEWDLHDGILSFEIQKKPYCHRNADLQADYRTFMKKCMAITSSYIERCEIEHDDYGCEHYYYTDKEVREF